MKQSSSDQESIIKLLTRIYLDIFAIEEEFQLLAGVDDFRPRIDYFHDAMRAFTSGTRVERLTVELLAYDLQCLRYITSMPLAPFKPGGEMLSAGADMVVVGDSPMVKPKRPDRITRERISDLYQHYAVLFAALLKPTAGRDAQERSAQIDQEVIDINAIIAYLEQMIKNQTTISVFAAAVQHLEEDGLRQLLSAFIQHEKYKKKDDIKKMIAFLKKYNTNKDEKRNSVDNALHQYAMTQLAVYEESKDMIKKMAGQGMNLVGKFVEASLKDTQRQVGR